MRDSGIWSSLSKRGQDQRKGLESSRGAVRDVIGPCERTQCH